MARTPAPAVDPDVVVPRAVREAAERAETAQKTEYGVSEPAIVAGLAAPDGQAPPPDNGPQPPAGTGPSPSPRQSASPQEAQPVDWEAKYKTDAGRWEADRKRNQERFDQMSERVRQMETQMLTQPPAAQQPPPTRRPVLTPEEMNDYGEDFINVVQKIVGSEVDFRLAPVAQEIGRTRAQIGVTQNKTMHQQMDALFPDWQKVNQYQPFIEWTQLPDTYSGVTRQRLMQDAWDAGDARRVYAFIQGFLAEDAALHPQGDGRQPASAPASPIAPRNGAPAAAPPLTLQDLAAPGGARSVQPAPTEKPVYTSEDISKFFTDCAAGRWRSREPERAAIEADIFRAQHEGRVISARRFTPPPPPRGMTQ